MYENEVGRILSLTIRLEDTAGADVTGKVNGDLTVKKSDKDDTGLVTIASGNRSLIELGEGDYTLKVAASIIDTLGFFRAKISCAGCVTKQYVVEVIPARLDVYFKSTGDDSLNDGSLDKPYKTLGQCKTHIASRPGFTIHVLDNPANVAGNKDQSIGFPVRIKGHGFPWNAPVPTNYNIGVSTAALDVILEDLNDIKIDLDASARNITMRACHDVSYINGFSEWSKYEDCIFSATITGTGTGFGNRSKWIRCVFKENVDINITLDGGIFKDCVFEKDLDTGVAQFTVYDNCVIHGVLTGENNTAFAGQVIFKNPYVNNNATLNGKKYILIGGVIRGALTLEVNSIDCVIWQTRIKGGLTDSGTTNEVINKAAWTIPADKMDLIDTLKNKAGASGYDRTTDSLEAIGEKAQDVISKAKFKDIIFNREVTQRHDPGPGEDKPKTVLIGAAGAEGTVSTLIDGDGNLDKESIA